jgi:hypothetical protein
MAVSPESAIVRARLDELGVDYTVAPSGAFCILHGTTGVYVSAHVSGERTVIRLVAPVLADVDPDPTALAEVLALNAQLDFGKFSWFPNERLLCVAHELLGETLDRDELDVAVAHVGSIADVYDERLKRTLGGRRPHVDEV